MESLSEEFLKSIGECCGSGCRNCPYTPRYMKGNVFMSQLCICDSDCPPNHVCVTGRCIHYVDYFQTPDYVGTKEEIMIAKLAYIKLNYDV